MRHSTRLGIVLVVLGTGCTALAGNGLPADAGTTANRGTPLRGRTLQAPQVLPVCGGLGSFMARGACSPAPPPLSWPSLAREPMDLSASVALEPCSPAPECLVLQVRRLEPELADRGVLVLTAKGVEVHGPADRLTPASFLDVKHTTWVTHGWFSPKDSVRAAFTSPTSSKVALCTLSPQWSTAPGFQVAGPCAVFDLSTREVLFHLPQGELDGEVTGLHGSVAQFEVYLLDVPRWCRKARPGDSMPSTVDAHASRMGPLHELKAQVDLSASPPRVRGAVSVFSFSDTTGEEADGRCTGQPP